MAKRRPKIESVMLEESAEEPAFETARRFGAASILVWGCYGAMCLAITYNALVGQAGLKLPLASQFGDGGQTAGADKVASDSVPGGSTIQLKYDPLVEEVQRQLLASGYYKGTIDGVMGKKTRQAIQFFQKDAGVEITGEASADLPERIRYMRQISEASLFTGTVDASPDAEKRALIRRIQSSLTDLRYEPGAINGELSEETKAAISKFESEHGMAPTGEPSETLLASLEKLSEEAEKAAAEQAAQKAD